MKCVEFKLNLVFYIRWTFRTIKTTTKLNQLDDLKLMGFRFIFRLVFVITPKRKQKINMNKSKLNTKTYYTRMYRNAFISHSLMWFECGRVFMYSHSLCFCVSVVSRNSHTFIKQHIHTHENSSFQCCDAKSQCIAVAIAFVVIALVGRPSQHRTYGRFSVFFTYQHWNVDALPSTTYVRCVSSEKRTVASREWRQIPNLLVSGRYGARDSTKTRIQTLIHAPKPMIRITSMWRHTNKQPKMNIHNAHTSAPRTFNISLILREDDEEKIWDLFN